MAEQQIEYENEHGETVTLQAPLVHLNGSGGPALVEDFREAAQAVREAYDALAKITPHGRDYYPLGDTAYRAARNEHMARMVQLRRIERELMTLAIAVQDQVDDRRKRA